MLDAETQVTILAIVCIILVLMLCFCGVAGAAMCAMGKIKLLETRLARTESILPTSMGGAKANYTPNYYQGALNTNAVGPSYSRNFGHRKNNVA